MKAEHATVTPATSADVLRNHALKTLDDIRRYKDPRVAHFTVFGLARVLGRVDSELALELHCLADDGYLSEVSSERFALTPKGRLAQSAASTDADEA